MFASLILTVPVFTAFAIAYAGHTLYAIRANIPACAGLLLIAGYSFQEISNAKIRALAVLGMTVVSLANLDHNIFHHQHKNDFRAAIGFVEEHAIAGDLVLFNPGFNYVNVCSYYCKRTDLTIIPFPRDDVDIRGAQPISATDLIELGAMATSHANVWVLFSQSKPTAINEISAAIGKSHQYSSRQSFFQVDVVHFADRPESGISGSKDESERMGTENLP